MVRGRDSSAQGKECHPRNPEVLAGRERRAGQEQEPLQLPDPRPRVSGGWGPGTAGPGLRLPIGVPRGPYFLPPSLTTAEVLSVGPEEGPHIRPPLTCHRGFRLDSGQSQQKGGPGASLVAQWLRIRLPTQGTRGPSLVWEDPTCCRATKPVRHNY